MPLKSHEYFHNVVRHMGRDAYILVAATENPTKGKYFKSQSSANRPTRLQSSKSSSTSTSYQSGPPTPPQSRPPVPSQSRSPVPSQLTPPTDDDFNACARLTDEQKLARKEAKKQKLAAMRQQRTHGTPDEEYGVVTSSSRRLPDQENFENEYVNRPIQESRVIADPVEERLADSSSTSMRKIVRNIVLEKTIGGPMENINPGRMYDIS
jgi:hypothetical protein